MKWKGKKCLIDNILYVDDGAFAYSSKQELENGTQQLHDHLAKFGLQMHVGSENTKSKTEQCLHHHLSKEPNLKMKPLTQVLQ